MTAWENRLFFQVALFEQPLEKMIIFTTCQPRQPSVKLFVSGLVVFKNLVPLLSVFDQPRQMDCCVTMSSVPNSTGSDLDLGYT
jgi:hypothetical protein